MEAPRLFVKCRFALWRISRALPSLKYVLLLSIDKHRGIRLLALFRFLSCFLEASAALLSQVQVYPSGASAEPCRALNVSVFSTKKYSRPSQVARGLVRVSSQNRMKRRRRKDLQRMTPASCASKLRSQVALASCTGKMPLAKWRKPVARAR